MDGEVVGQHIGLYIIIILTDFLDVGEGITKCQETDGEGEMGSRAELERAWSQFHTVANDILAHVDVPGFDLYAPDGSEHCNPRREIEAIPDFQVICQVGTYQNQIGVLTKPPITAFIIRIGLQSILHRGTEAPSLQLSAKNQPNSPPALKEVDAGVPLSADLTLEYPPETPIIPPIETSPFFCAETEPQVIMARAAQTVNNLFIVLNINIFL